MTERRPAKPEETPIPGVELRFEERIATPFDEFVRDQTTSSLLLVVCTLAALAIVSGGYADRYEEVLHLPVALQAGEWKFELSLQHWINEGLMATFFFLLGLETKREFLAGELRDRRRATLVTLAALGGMVAPALLYVLCNLGEATARGWAVPVATDAAFALGAIRLLGARLPAGLITFLAAFAIIDDIGAVTLIALFYSSEIEPVALATAIAVFVLLLGVNVLGIRHPWVYLLGGVSLWAAVHASGVHGTVAGVMAALAVPARPRLRPEDFAERTGELLRELDRARRTNAGQILGARDQHETIESVRRAARGSTTPLQRWEIALAAPVGLLVVPIFALANAGVEVSGEALRDLASSPAALGIVLGLVVGKVVGVSGMCWLALKLGVGELPEGVSMGHVLGLGMLAGMGFTMSLFVADLSFSGEVLSRAKLAILAGSFSAAAMGLGSLWLVSRRRSPPACADPGRWS